MSIVKPKVLILKGLPASGKTTFAKNLQRQQKGKWKRINHDELRLMLDDGYFEKGMETSLLKVRNAMIDIYLEEGLNIILDNTHLSSWVLKDVIGHIGNRADIEVKFFDAGLKSCIKRDAFREKPVGEKVIREMDRKLQSRKDTVIQKPTP